MPTNDNDAGGRGSARMPTAHERHREQMLETLAHEKADRTKRDHCNRLKSLYEFWEKYYPDYYGEMVRPLTPEDMSHPERFYYKNRHDIKYESLSADMVILFMSSKKRKANGKSTSHAHLRKFHDAVLYGARQRGVDLSREGCSYQVRMKQYLTSLGKETAKAKQDGNMDDSEADPIPFALYRKICEWCVTSENNIFVWVWTILQWNCMARSINIEPLSFHNFGVAADCLKVKYDQTKANKEGDRCTWKRMCMLTRMTRLSVSICHLACGYHWRDTALRAMRRFFQIRKQKIVPCLVSTANS